MDRSRTELTLERVRNFYESDVVLQTFNDGFSGRWHTRVIPDAPGPKNSETYVAHLLGLEAHHVALDFGCGVGVVACSVAALTGCSIRGLNISRKQIAQADALRAVLGLADRVRFDLYPGAVFPYPNDAFDRIYFFESPCHVPDKGLMVREFYRVLRPGGTVAGQDWVLATDRLSARDHGTWIRPIEESCDVALRSLKEYRDLFADAGFVNIEITDARDVYRNLRRSFVVPDGSAVRVSADDTMADRLAKGNMALSNAFDRGLFTVGFLRGEKPARRTIVEYRVRADGSDFESGTTDVYDMSKNMSAVRFHTHTFDVPDSPWLRHFESLVTIAERATIEASCKVANGRRHACRFNLFFHENTKNGYALIRDFLARGAADTHGHLDTRQLEAFVGDDLDFARVSKVVTGVDLRASPGDSRLKIWFVLQDYPERVERALRFRQTDARLRRLIVHDGFLVGFDFHLDGRSSVKLYPYLRDQDLTNVDGVLSDAAMQAMRQCSMTHVYFSHHDPVVFQFHPHDPDAFVRAYLDADLYASVHSIYQGRRLLDMVVSLREGDLGGNATDCALYYMPLDPRLIGGGSGIADG
jgi:LynF/TruF/PatF family peptide O-prenyltransferase